jgi:hypothetical protein
MFRLRLAGLANLLRALVVAFFVLLLSTYQVEGQGFEPLVSVRMFSRTVFIELDSSERVWLSLYDSSDVLLATGAAVTNGAGTASIELEPVSGESLRGVRPGDRLSVSAERSGDRSILVPAMVIDLDPTGEMLVGRAPPGELVEVILGRVPGRDASSLITVRAAADGSLEVPLGALHTFTPGEFGDAVLRPAPDVEIRTRFVAFGAALWLGQPWSLLEVTPGSSVTIAVDSGRAPPIERRILHEPRGLSPSHYTLYLDKTPSGRATAYRLS